MLAIAGVLQHRQIGLLVVRNEFLFYQKKQKDVNIHYPPAEVITRTQYMHFLTSCFAMKYIKLNKWFLVGHSISKMF